MNVTTGKVLLIDDDENVHTMLRYHLDRAGFELCSAKDPNGAIQMIQQHPLDFLVILVDINLPRADMGWALLGRLGKMKQDQLSTTPIVVYSIDDDKARAKASGADMHLLKPANHKALISLIENYATQRSKAEET
jgi:two-component system alkaline phosphatase synthesis response regulator PhoP